MVGASDRNRPLYMISVAAQLADELDSLHKRYQRLARRVSELDPNTPVNALVRMSDLPPVFHWLTNTSQTVRFFAK